MQRLAELVAGYMLAAAILRTHSKAILDLTLARGLQHVGFLGLPGLRLQGKQFQELCGPRGGGAAATTGRSPNSYTSSQAGWQSLDGHLKVVSKIGAVASAFGPMMGAFPQIVPYANAEGFRLADAAILCTTGDLVTDSAPLGRPDQGHRTSPWARVTLKLHSISEARDRYRQWPAIDEHGQMHQKPKPRNPFRDKAAAT